MNDSSNMKHGTPAPAATVIDEEINLGDLLSTIWAGKFWIMLCVLLSFGMGAYYVFGVATPKYTSSAVLMLENQRADVVDIGSVVNGISGDQTSINTELEVFRARGLIEKVVLEMNLQNDPEFNGRLRPKPWYSTNSLIRLVKELLGQGEAKSGTAAVLSPEAQTIRDRKTLDATINRTLRAIRVNNTGKSYVFRIVAVTEDPVKSATLANTLAEFYIQDQLEVKFEVTEQATQWLSERVATLQIELETAEAAVKDFNANTDLISADGLFALNRQIKDLRERHDEIKRSIETTAERRSQMLAVREAGDVDAVAELANDRTIDRLATSLQNGAENALSSIWARFDTVLEQLDQELARSLSQEEVLGRSLLNLEVQIEEQSSDLVTLKQLQREAEASRLIYEYFLSRLKETSVQQGIQQADSRMLSSAVVPNAPSSPRVYLSLVISAVLGGLIGIGLVLLRELSQTGFRTASGLEKASGQVVLGQIPIIPIRKRKGVLQYLEERPNSIAAEAVRNLRTSILLSNIDNPPKIIMSTSSLPGEGKTTQSLALAMNFSSIGQKVLLIEGDIRRRVFSQYFSIDDPDGLLSVLSGKKTLQETVVRVDQLGADVLLGEQSTVNAADIFSSDKFSAFLKDASKQYDVVIIDTPPVLIVPDARVIGQSVDAIIYTVKWDSTTKNQLRDGLRMFETVNLKVAGLVLSQIDERKQKRYGYGTYYGAYGAGYYRS